MDVTFVCSSGEAPFTMEVGFFDTVQDIKQKLQGRKGWPAAAAALTLSYDGHTLAEDDGGAGVTERYGVVEGSIIHVVLDNDGDRRKKDKVEIRKPGKIRRDLVAGPLLRVTVVSRCGTRHVEVAVVPRGAVSALRGELERASSGGSFPLPRDGGYFFIHGQSVMDEERSFEWHGVAAGDEVVVFPGSVTRGPAC